MSHENLDITGDAVIDPTAAGVRLPAAELARVVPEIHCGAPTPCPACAGTRFVRVARADRYGFPLDYVACRGCGLVFANPYYDAGSLDPFYRRHYATVYGRHSHTARAFAHDRDRGGAVRALVERHARSLARDYSSALDVGCSNGGLLAAFPDHWLRVGYDYDESLFAVGRSKGLELGDIARLDAEPRRFDVVMANQVLEHTRDPVAFLRRIARLLSPGGVLYVEVPGLRSDAFAAIDYRLMFKNAHCFLFEARTFESCAARAGLRCAFVDESVSALLVPGDNARLAGTIGEAPADTAIAFIRGKVERYRPPGVLARLASASARIANALGRRMGVRN